MKKRGIKIINSIFWSVLLVGILLQYGCKSNNSGMSPKPVITGVRDIHPDSAAVNKIGPGQTVVIEGNNLITTKEITFDGYQTSINQTLFTDTTVISTIPSSLPFSKVKSDSLNQIHLVTKFGETTYKFPILPPKPMITSVSNEFAYPGEKINIGGNYLYLVKSIVFPGDIKATQYSGVADGSRLTVTVPQGVTQSNMGSIKIETQAGTALSAPMAAFHDTTGMICNFDNDNTFSWWSGTRDNTASTFPNGWGYYGHMKADSVSAGDASWWNSGRSLNFNNDQWIAPSHLTDPINDYAFKFEVYVKAPMSNGEIRIVPGHYQSNGNFAPANYVGLYNPWKNSLNYTTDGWQTIVIPLNDFKTNNGTGSGAASLTQILDSNGSSALSIEYVNSGSAPQSIDMAFDNIRVVKIK